MSAAIREWRSEEWEYGDKARTHKELQCMFKSIIEYADIIENKPTPGSSRPSLSRCLVCTNSLLPGTKYIIHIEGFTVEDIVEIVEL